MSNNTNTDTDASTGTDTDLSMQSVSAVTWVDDDGTRYRRTMEDGEINDEVIGHE